MKTVQIYVQNSPMPAFLTEVIISETAGQFSCTASIVTLVVDDTITISGINGGTGNLINYVSPKIYYIIATNGTTTFTLSEKLQGTAITTTTGTPTGLSYVVQPTGQYNILDLFKDEKVSVTSSIQNINDIAKTFSDFSQTFTVPASVNNNFIFKHWYENANDYGFSTLKKSLAYIEIDTILFRKGKIELKSVKMSNGRPESYTISFIGSLGTLKDKFSNLYLKDLDSTSTNFLYTGENVLNSIIGASNTVDQKIMWPLISSDRFWNYNNVSDATNNINNSLYPIRYNELFPALRVKNIFDLISEDSKWDINFTGSFLYDPRFEAAYLWIKNTEIFVNLSENIPLKYNQEVYNNTSVMGITYSSANYFLLNKETGIIETLNSTTGRLLTVTVILENLPIPIPSPRMMTIKLYKNNVEYQSVTLATGTGTVVQTLLFESPNEANAKFDARITTDQDVTFRGTLALTSKLSSISFTAQLKAANFFDSPGLQTIEDSSLIKTKQYFPEIKIEDFVTGIIKMFNLVCFSEDNINYTIEQLENFYQNGNFIDITEYIKIDNNSFNSVPAYNKINFEYTKSESKINVDFINRNSIEYGDFRAPLDFDGPEYSIKLPFENLEFENLRDSLQVGYAIKTDGQKYVTKPVILYSYITDFATTLENTTFYFSTKATGATATVQIYGINLTSVTITTTGGQFSCASSILKVGKELYIYGINNGTGNIVGYVNPKSYYIIATNGTTTFTLSETLGGAAITTAIGTPAGLTYQLIGQYKPFGQDFLDIKSINTTAQYVGDHYSLNFPTQESTLTRTIVDKGLYNQYYQDYLSNTFTPKARVFNITANLPTEVLTSIKLNDKIIIRDKRYIINTMTTDLTSGEVQFSLLTDFRIDQEVIYNTTIIGTQSWVTKALDVTTYRNGDPILQVTDTTQWAGLTSGAWCYYNNDELNGTRFGKLYNSYAVNDVRGLAPLGYHIPTNAEWSKLFTTIGGTSSAGLQLKQRGNNNWPSPSAGLDSYIFRALPSGYRTEAGAFTELPNYGYYHTSSTQSSTTNWYYYFVYNSNSGFQNYGSNKFGMAVRIIKD
jgi:uncharacterized protein (TIGR02145 family)